MLDCLAKCVEKGVAIGIVSGSDLTKVKEQCGDALIKSADYTFSENGLYAMRKGELFAKQSIKDQLGEANLKRLINFSLRYIADLDIPIKRYDT